MHPAAASQGALAGDASHLSSALVCSVLVLPGFPSAVADPGVAVFVFCISAPSPWFALPSQLKEKIFRFAV